MSLDELRALRANPSRRQAAEFRAIAFAVKPVIIDFASTMLFYVALALGADVRAATALGAAMGLGQLLYMVMRRQRISPMQSASFILVLLVGGLTVITNDARIMFWKVSAIYLVVGTAMLQPGWILRFVPPIAADHLPREVMIRWGFVWAALILCTGAVNLALSLIEPARVVAQVMGVIAPMTKIMLFAAQYFLLRKRVLRTMAAQLDLSQ
jgi:intracellular septation protein A